MGVVGYRWCVREVVVRNVRREEFLYVEQGWGCKLQEVRRRR
jgi:hypothetical protein